MHASSSCLCSLRELVPGPRRARRGDTDSVGWDHTSNMAIGAQRTAIWEGAMMDSLPQSGARARRDMAPAGVSVRDCMQGSGPRERLMKGTDDN